MLSFYQNGNPVDHVVTTDTDAGTVFDLSTIGYQPGAGVTTNFTTAGSPAALQTGGVFICDNDLAVAFTADDDAFYDPADGLVHAATAAGRILVGKIFKDNAATDSLIYVLINNKLSS